MSLIQRVYDMRYILNRPWSTPLIQSSWNVAWAATDAMSIEANAKENSIAGYFPDRMKTQAGRCARACVDPNLGIAPFMPSLGLEPKPGPRVVTTFPRYWYTLEHAGSEKSTGGR